MGGQGNKPARKPFFSGFYSNRRTFLRNSAFAALSAASVPAMARHLAKFDAATGGMTGTGRKNTLPGRVIILHDTGMQDLQFNIDRDQVEAMVLRGVQLLTQTEDVGEAFESLFPDLQANSTIAIKVNCIGPTCTRWEVARGVVSGLSQMLDGTYDVSNVTLFDRHNIPGYGYDEAEFTFNGHTPTLSTTNNASGSGHDAVDGYELSRYIINADYLINLPVLKSHSDGNNQITVALKNHYGSCSPSSLCGNIPGMLTLNSDEYIKNKTCLVITDALRGTWNGGPTVQPQLWSTYDEQTPNTLLVTTDPVTNDYWAREMINTERVAQSSGEKPCPWIEQASGSPYEIGVSDPDQMTVVEADADTPQTTSTRSWGGIKTGFR